jgi:hypothetical protein
MIAAFLCPASATTSPQRQGDADIIVFSLLRGCFEMDEIYY